MAETIRFRIVLSPELVADTTNTLLSLLEPVVCRVLYIDETSVAKNQEDNHNCMQTSTSGSDGRA